MDPNLLMMRAAAIQVHDHRSIDALRWEHASLTHSSLSDSIEELTEHIKTEAFP